MNKFKKATFWVITLCALLVIAGVNGWSLPLRIAVAANAVVVILEVVHTILSYRNNNEEEDNDGI